MSVELLELAASTLGEALNEVVFLGGATVTLWITDPGAPPVRPTKDVDVVVEATTRMAFHDFEARLRELHFTEDQEDGVICRWRHRDSDLILDAMPADPGILGFANRWQGTALPHALERPLPSGATIRAVPPPYLLATKLEAFHGRGHSDLLASRDFADIVALVDGRSELVAEAQATPSYALTSPTSSSPSPPTRASSTGSSAPCAQTPQAKPAPTPSSGHGYARSSPHGNRTWSSIAPRLDLRLAPRVVASLARSVC